MNEDEIQLAQMLASMDPSPGGTASNTPAGRLKKVHGFR